jgi:integrase
VLIALTQVCRFAVRRGWLTTNPVAKLEPGEKPRWTPKRAAILEGDQLVRFLAAAEARRPLFEFLADTGMRIGEALGLTWADIDYDNGLIRVHRQLTRHRVQGRSRRPQARRLERRGEPALAQQLGDRGGEHDLALSPTSR